MNPEFTREKTLRNAEDDCTARMLWQWLPIAAKMTCGSSIAVT